MLKQKLIMKAQTYLQMIFKTKKLFNMYFFKSKNAWTHTYNHVLPTNQHFQGIPKTLSANHQLLSITLIM